MGLDMYLYAKLHTTDRDFETEKKREINKKVRKFIPEIFESGNLNSIEISFEVGYWRKANHIHNWFVENIQNGEDNCGSYYVSREDLEKLKETCKKVLELLKKSKKRKTKVKIGWSEKEGDLYEDIQIYKDVEEIKELLPTRGGFFFGGTEYDEWYKKDVEKTIEIINKCLTLPQEWGFEYTSSW